MYLHLPSFTNYTSVSYPHPIFIPSPSHHHHYQDHAIRKLLEQMDFSEHVYILEVRGLLEGRQPAHEFILLA